MVIALSYFVCFEYECEFLKFIVLLRISKFPNSPPDLLYFIFLFRIYFTLFFSSGFLKFIFLLRIYCTLFFSGFLKFIFLLRIYKFSTGLIILHLSLPIKISDRWVVTASHCFFAPNSTRPFKFLKDGSLRDDRVLKNI